MSTSVLLTVTPKDAIDADRFTGDVPADIATALRAAGQTVSAGLSQIAGGPWRLRFSLSGEDRVATGQRLEGRLRELGYETDLSFSP